ncbi:MAG: serine protease [Verrucomicrobia bacterium]|nr:serine protease [Verrucomicrobiota bacterium]
MIVSRQNLLGNTCAGSNRDVARLALRLPAPKEFSRRIWSITIVTLALVHASEHFGRAALPPIKTANDKSARANAGANNLPAAFRKSSPASLDDFKAIEQHIKALLPKISSAVVAVQVGGATGSAVVISEDGLVLTAAHVCEEPNRNVRFIFPDGRTARGKTLGTNHEVDAGMMKITDHGPWPHVEMGDLSRARLGDWVLTLGHPGGFDPERPVVVRLGRIIRFADDALQTDCTITAGDSGGPLFDMRGGVIGIHSWIADSAAANFHVPITPFRDSWDRLAKAESWGGDQSPPRPWIGARGVDHPAGCQLETVPENGPAFKAGVKIGDIVKRINDHEVHDYASLRRLVAEAKPGDELKLELLRGEGNLSVMVKVEARPRRR